jgi:starvation-inducible DNA-binding protein
VAAFHTVPDWNYRVRENSMANGTPSALNDEANNRSFLNADNGEGAAKITATLNVLLADVFTLYFKTRNFHWHMTGPHFRDYHLLLDEQAEQIFGTTDAIAARVRKVGGSTLR